MEEKIYELMAQAETLQEHAVELQNKASEAISEIPEAIDKVKETIRSTALLSAIIWIIFGVVIFLGVWIALEWSTNHLREERNRLQNQISELQGVVQDEQKKIAEMQSERWGIELVSYKDGQRGIRIPKDMEFDRITSDSTNKDVVLVKRKGQRKGKRSGQ